MPSRKINSTSFEWDLVEEQDFSISWPEITDKSTCLGIILSTYTNHQQTSPSSSGLSSQKRTKAYKSHQKSTSSMSCPHLFRKHCRFLRRRRGRHGRIARRLRRGWRGWWHGCRHGTWGALENAPGVRCWKHVGWRGIWTFWCGVSEWLLKISRTWEYKGCQPTCSWYKKSGCKCEQSIWPLKVCQEKVWWHPMAFKIHYSDTMVALRRVHSLLPSLSQLPWPLTNSKACLALTRYETP